MKALSVDGYGLITVDADMGLRNFGAHTNNAEYVNISSIEPRLYLVTRVIMDIAAGRAGVPAPAAR